MNRSKITSKSSRIELKNELNIIRQLPIVLVVAAIVATLFTAWTDPGLLPIQIGGKFVIAEPLPIPAASANLSQSTNPQLPSIGIIAGHSGNDSGAVCASDGLTEVSINQNVAALVQKRLAELGVQSEILEEFDIRLSGYKAVALVSIHADSCDFVNDQATGYKVAPAMARTYPERSSRLVACLRNNYGQITGLPLHNSITDDMTSYHAFDEINPETIAAIIEIGFMNLDRQLLTQNPDLVADGITKGIICYLNNETVPTLTVP